MTLKRLWESCFYSDSYCMYHWTKKYNKSCNIGAVGIFFFTKFKTINQYIISMPSTWIVIAQGVKLKLVPYIMKGNQISRHGFFKMTEISAGVFSSFHICISNWIFTSTCILVLLPVWHHAVIFQGVDRDYFSTIHQNLKSKTLLTSS